MDALTAQPLIDELCNNLSHEFADVQYAIETYEAHCNLMLQVKAHHNRVQADEFIRNSAAWIRSLAHGAMKALKLRLADMDDLRHDLIVRVYELAQHFDEERGIPFDKYIAGTLRFHLFSNRTQTVYFNTVAGRPTFSIEAPNSARSSSMYAGGENNATAMQIEDKKEISSLEIAADVFKHVADLDSHDKLLIDLIFTQRLQYKQIEDMLGLSHGTIWHRMSTIIKRIQSNVTWQSKETK